MKAFRKEKNISAWKLAAVFYDDSLPTLFDYLPGADIFLGVDADNALKAKEETIADHYEARLEALKIREVSDIDKYRPVPPEFLFLDAQNFAAQIHSRRYVLFSKRSMPESNDVADYGATPQKIFASLKNINNLTVYEDLAQEFGRNKDKKGLFAATATVLLTG